MKKISKKKISSSSLEAVSEIKNGSVVSIGGFGGIGIPENLLEALLKHDVCNLTIVSNHAGQGERGLSALIKQKKVKKLICSYAFHKNSYIFRDLFLSKEIELEQVPQGTLAERLRAGGAGIPAFYTRTAVDTDFEKGKEIRNFNGEKTILEFALQTDFSLIKCHQADTLGNLTYKGTAGNFNPVMAKAAKITIAETELLLETGEIEPESVQTPSIYVNKIVVGEDIGLRSEI